MNHAGDNPSSQAPVIGVDIGGTKCAVCKLETDGTVTETARIPTASWEETSEKIVEAVYELNVEGSPTFGISAGTLRAAEGLISDMPNLPGWDDIPIVDFLEQQFGGRAFLLNDAKACALAEWKFGAGKGFRHLAFLTAGTGMGAGLILNGQLYLGTGNAGEVGHMRISPDGPFGHGKHGAFEGWCSGGGIGRYARDALTSRGRNSGFFGGPLDRVSAREVTEAAVSGHALAREILTEVGYRLGQGLALLIDALALECIILGSVYVRSRRWLEPSMRQALQEEALPGSLAACHILPAALGEQIGNYGAISVVKYFTEWQK